jgi:hypothetical protein
MDILNMEPVILVKSRHLTLPWAYISFQSIDKLLTYFSNELFCELSLKSHIVKSIYAIRKSFIANFSPLFNEQNKWFISYESTQKWLSTLSVYGVSDLNYWQMQNPGSNMADAIRQIELAMVRCQECRLSINYALINHLSNSVVAIAKDSTSSLARTDTNKDASSKKLSKSKIIEDVMDLNPIKGWLRNDIFSRIREISANTLATKLLADSSLLESLISLMNKSLFRPRVSNIATSSSSSFSAPVIHYDVEGNASLRDLGNGMEEYINLTMKPVEQLHIETGEVLRRYSSGREAARAMHVSQSGICLCCNGKKNDAHGFRWRFVLGKYTLILTIFIRELSHSFVHVCMFIFYY